MGIVKTLSFSFVVLAAVVSHAEAPATQPLDALHQKELQRQAERAQVVQITAGELEDLRAQVRMLKAQNETLTKRLAAQAAAPKKARPTEIVVGMTKEDVLDFVKSHPREMRVDSERFGTHESGSSTVHTNKTTVKADGSTAPQNQSVQESISQDTTVSRDETIVISKMGPQPVVVGQTRDIFGVTHDQMGTQYVPVGRITITITDGVVSALEGERIQ